MSSLLFKDAFWVSLFLCSNSFLKLRKHALYVFFKWLYGSHTNYKLQPNLITILDKKNCKTYQIYLTIMDSYHYHVLYCMLNNERFLPFKVRISSVSM